MSEKQKAFGATITKLINGRDLTRQEARDAFCQVLNDEQPELQQGAFLAALTAKGETAEEIAGSWEAIYELDTVKISPSVTSPFVENCGTGMDTLKTFNISTASSIIAAAAGITMAKHGARAITSACGTVDMLEMLGVDVECEPEIVKKSIERAGIGIFNGMSSKVHPMALGRILSQIAFGTTLNIAASLANPVLPQYAVRGVYSKELVYPVAMVMKEIGFKRALVIHGLDRDGVEGMDEASTLGETVIAELRENGQIEEYSLMPQDFGIIPAAYSDIAPSSNKEEEALRFIAVLSGKGQGAREDIVCLNSALILYLMGVVQTIYDGYMKSKEIISSGQALSKLREWVREQNTDPVSGERKLEHMITRALN